MTRKPPRRPPGIREVAARAGVGIASVSRALSGQGSSAGMVERVLRAARELGYTPNALARGLRLRATRSIGFVGADITNPLLAAIVGGAESVLSEAGYSVLLTHSGGLPERDAERIEVLRQRQVDGLILLPALENDRATLAALRATDTPVVIIDRELPADINVSYVLSDHYAGVGAAARHLLEGGHRRIGLAVGPDVRPSRERVRAVKDQAKAFGAARGVLVDSGSLSDAHGELAMDRFLNAGPRVTAVILGGNQMLEGALRAVRRRGLLLGRDLSLVCCDDLPLSRMHDPPIATVMRDTGLIGQRAAEVLLQQIRSPLALAPVVLPTWFERRDSCQPLH